MRTQRRLGSGNGRRFSHRKLGVLGAIVALALVLSLCFLWVSFSSTIFEDTETPARALPNEPQHLPDRDGAGHETPNIPATLAAGEVPVRPFVSMDTARAKTSSFNDVVEDRTGEKSVITHAIADGVEMLFPLITFRDRLTAEEGHGPEQWRSRHLPNDSFRMPTWASVKERNTLRHASIFISIAAFRDHECATTLESALANAASPHRIYAGISEERRPTDVNCLHALQLPMEEGGSASSSGGGGGAGAGDAGGEDASSRDTATARTLLYGKDAPSSIVIKTRRFRWADLLLDPVTKLPNSISIAAARAAYNTPGDTTAKHPVPAGIYMEDTFMEHDRITCVYSDLEAERDRLTLEEGVAPAEVRAVRVRKGRLGGPQEQPSEALRGCRVVTRVTPEQSARGPTFGRYVTSLFFSHQDYYMVVDSHSRFPVDWDLKMIARVFQMETHGVLSHYPNGYTPADPTKEYGQASTMSMCKGVILSNGMPKLGARWMALTDHPVIDAFAAAGYMFGDAQYVLDTPFDPFLPYLFDGEEILYSARMWTSGWDMYAPGQPNLFHHYLRSDTPKFWALVRAEETRQRMVSERRALFLLERSQPWYEILVRRGINVSAPFDVPYEAPDTRRIVTSQQADLVAGIGLERVYYGMGTARTLDAYWNHTQLTDAFVTRKDNENRWEGGLGLCDMLDQFS